MMVLDTQPTSPVIPSSLQSENAAAQPVGIFAQLLSLFLPPPPAANIAAPAPADSSASAEPTVDGAGLQDPELAGLGQLLSFAQASTASAAESEALASDAAREDEPPADDLTREIVAAPVQPAPPIIFQTATELGTGENQRWETQPPAMPLKLPTEPAAELTTMAAPQPIQITEQPAVVSLAQNVAAPGLASAASKHGPSPRPAPVIEGKLESETDVSSAPVPARAPAVPVVDAANIRDGAAEFLGGEDSANQLFQRHGAHRQDLDTPTLQFSAVAPAIHDGQGQGGGAPAWRPTVDGLARQIADHARIGKQEALLQLDPPDLGKVNITLRLEDGQLHVRIAAEGGDAQRLIEHHLGDLHQALRGGQIDVADLQVTQGDWQAGGGLTQDFNGPPQERQDGTQGFAGLARRDDAVAEPTRPAPRRADGRVSMWA